jgi:putative exosortase-associated protein (TIGR04073 family)
MRRPASWGLGLLLCVVFALLSMAETKYSSARKLGRGVANLSTGVLALPGEIVDTTREKGPFVGATWGVVKGVGMTVVTEVIGLWEIVTCPFQFPPDWKPIISPEFPWQHFDPNRKDEDVRVRPVPRIR